MIDRCVRCGYSLTGLPTVHRCPECGRENDRESIVIREPRFWANVSTAAGTVGTAIFTTLTWLQGGRWSWRIMIALAALAIAWLWIQVSRRARVVVVSRRFLELIDEGFKTKSFSMENVADAHWSFVTGRTRITDRQGRVIVTIPNKFFTSLRANRKVVRAIKAQVARRESAAIPESAAPRK